MNYFGNKLKLDKIILKSSLVLSNLPVQSAANKENPESLLKDNLVAFGLDVQSLISMVTYDCHNII